LLKYLCFQVIKQEFFAVNQLTSAVKRGMNSRILWMFQPDFARQGSALCCLFQQIMLAYSSIMAKCLPFDLFLS